MNYLEEIDKNKEDMIQTLADVVRIPSVQGEPYTDENGDLCPFGKNVEEVYRMVMDLGRSFGFETKDFDHYGGHIEFPADETSEHSDEVFGIAAHLDVVPEGKGWTSHGPYSADIERGMMYGRGTTDDKGPMIACLYAMKALKDAGVRPVRNIRLILGLDEETESRGMKYYLDAAGMPDFGITPDSEFPLINGEMGIMIFDIAQKFPRRNGVKGLILRKLTAGTAENIVPGGARAVIASDDKKDYDKIKNLAAEYSEKTGRDVRTRRTGKSIAVEAKGLEAHGASPERGINAISIMMDFLGGIDFAVDEVNDFISYYNDHIGFDLHGERLGCGFEDEESGKLILNAGLAELSEEAAQVTICIRYPVTETDDHVYQGIEKTLENTDVGIVKRGTEPPVYMSPDDPFAKMLIEAYVEETGDTEHGPSVESGGTYAKLMKRVMAFGALFPGEEDRMHQADERISLMSFVKYAKIYARAIYKAACQ